MFWTTPIIGTFSFWNMIAPLLATSIAAAWGVVTSTTPDSNKVTVIALLFIAHLFIATTLYYCAFFPSLET
jgi:hypothetical protein